MGLLKQISDAIAGKAPLDAKRSSAWPKVREEFIKNNPTCACCGDTKKIEVHHIKPFHLNPELELEPSNLITLCESSSNGITCHLLIGHLGDYKSWNVNALKDAKSWNTKLKKRPYEKKEEKTS